MKRSHSLGSVALLIAVAGCAASTAGSTGKWRSSGARGQMQPSTNDDAGDDDGDEVKVRAEDLPESIRAAALAALPGLVIQEAELEEAGAVYCVHGTVDGKFREVEVTTAGAIATVEPQDGDGDDD